MQPLGDLVIGPTDHELWLGPITLGDGDDSLWLDVVQTAPTQNWRYSYALVSFVTDEGAELGTTKIYGNLLGEVFRLGIRRPPVVRTGRIRFVSRPYNLRWLAAQGAPQWELSFAWESGQSGSGAPALGTRATLSTLARVTGQALTWAITNGTARILLPGNVRRSPDSN